jgi:hypothetical protein
MIIVNLVGGLGNQLFQMSAAQAISLPNERIVLEYGLGTTRLLPSGEPEICSYELPSNFRLSKRKGFFAHGIAKVIGYTLRKQREIPKSRLSKVVTSSSLKMCQITLFAYYRRPLKLICPADLGYSDIVRTNNMFLSGYFQTYFWPDSILDALKGLVASSDQLEKYKQLAVLEEPIVLHIRRGDYKTEDTFGLLGSNYYSSALEYLESKTSSKNIWLFSDEPELAKEVLKFPSEMHIRVIPEMELSSAQLLEIMKLGSAYVIANSTYSWWAAFLSMSKHVVAPKIWFKDANGPSKLLPESWHKVTSSFE